MFRPFRRVEPSRARRPPGIILLQIDGLSRRQFQRALDSGRMPFVARRLAHGAYRLHSLYSGLPSSTPAVQAELIYGVKTAVPAFEYFDRARGEMSRMYDQDDAHAVEQELQRRGESLLSEGSSYSNLYSGGAASSRYCASRLGISDVFLRGRLGVLSMLRPGNLATLCRALALGCLETVIAVVDAVRGVALEGRHLGVELRFIPARVAICVVLRDFVTEHVILDALAGRPIIHANFLGYDEQAHRRGPSSRFAHWSLKGIDRRIRWIYRAAHRSTQRRYEVWVFSDHGQEETIPYPDHAGHTIEKAVCEVLAKDKIASGPAVRHRGIQFRRAALLGSRLIAKIVPWAKIPPNHPQPPKPVIAAMGPLAHVYLGRPLPETGRQKILEDMVRFAGVPIAMCASGPDSVIAVRESGTFNLPQDARDVLGAAHPFLREAAEDLVRLCHHRNAGDIVLSGWRPEATPISFPMENGSHAGPGSEETHAFLAVPASQSFAPAEGAFLRPLDMRRALLDIVGRPTRPEPVRPRNADGPARRSLRLVTYNIHSCAGTDGKVSPRRIADVLASVSPDIVALQEVDVGRNRTGGEDQASVIAELLGMRSRFYGIVDQGGGLYGLAVLSRYPIETIRSGRLPGPRRRAEHAEPRGALWVRVSTGWGPLNVITTHFGLRRREKMLQGWSLAGEAWVTRARLEGPLVLLGDLNSTPLSAVCRRLRRSLQDAWDADDNNDGRGATFPTYLPFVRIDHVFVDRRLGVSSVRVVRTPLARRASDHFPVCADIDFPARPAT